MGFYTSLLDEHFKSVFVSTISRLNAKLFAFENELILGTKSEVIRKIIIHFENVEKLSSRTLVCFSRSYLRHFFS